MRSSSAGTRIGFRAIVLFGLALGCTERSLSVGNEANAESDTALFAAVVRAIADSASFPLRMDPRIIGPAEFGTGPDAWVNAPAVVAVRRQVLASHGVATGSIDVPANCDGSINTAPGGDFRGCPREPVEVVSVGLPRSKSSHAPAQLRSYQAFRTRQLYIGGGGYYIENYEYVLAMTTLGWKLVSRVQVDTTSA